MEFKGTRYHIIKDSYDDAYYNSGSACPCVGGNVNVNFSFDMSGLFAVLNMVHMMQNLNDQHVNRELKVVYGVCFDD